MQMLKAKLRCCRSRNRQKSIRYPGGSKDIGFGNQIRSYVMQPYTLVKDHRTNVENGNVTAVLDGDLDMFYKTPI